MDIKDILTRIDENAKYESPISVYQTFGDISKKITEAYENEITMQINQYVEVDKEELVRALNYDRDQYYKGFNDGVESIKRELEVYVKALELACATIAYSAPRMDEPYYYVKQYLQRARGEKK